MSSFCDELICSKVYDVSLEWERTDYLMVLDKGADVSLKHPDGRSRLKTCGRNTSTSFERRELDISLFII